MTAAFNELSPETRAVIDILNVHDGYWAYAAQRDARACADALEALEDEKARNGALASISLDQQGVIASLRKENAMLRALLRQHPVPALVRAFNAAHPIGSIVAEVMDLRPTLDGRNRVAFCPWCRSNDALTVYVDDGAFHCCECGVGGDTHRFISLWSGKKGESA